MAYCFWDHCWRRAGQLLAIFFFFFFFFFHVLVTVPDVFTNVNWFHKWRFRREGYWCRNVSRDYFWGHYWTFWLIFSPVPSNNHRILRKLTGPNFLLAYDILRLRILSIIRSAKIPALMLVPTDKTSRGLGDITRSSLLFTAPNATEITSTPLG